MVTELTHPILVFRGSERLVHCTTMNRRYLAEAMCDRIMGRESMI